MKEVREYVENGITPEGLTQPVQDPEAHSGSEGEKEEGEKREGKANDTVAAVSENDEAPRKQEARGKVRLFVDDLYLQKREKVIHVPYSCVLVIVFYFVLC